MTGPKLVEFKKKPEPPQEIPRLPTEDELKWLLSDKPLRSAVLLLLNEDGEYARWIVNLNNYEAIGFMEQIKADILLGDIEDDE